jgi:hypothetical protein
MPGVEGRWRDDASLPPLAENGDLDRFSHLRVMGDQIGVRETIADDVPMRGAGDASHGLPVPVDDLVLKWIGIA